MLTEDKLFLFLNKTIFFTTSLSAWQTHMSHIIHVSEILMLNTIYHYYAVSGEINPVYLLQLFLLLLLRSYLVSIEKTKNKHLFRIRLELISITWKQPNNHWD
jgi:hypothetical protein